MAKRIFSSSARGLFILDNLGQSLCLFRILPLVEDVDTECLVRNISPASAAVPPPLVVLQGDRFNPLDFFGGECELFRLEVFFHVLLACGSGQREHADLHGKAKDDLGGTRA